jgi:Dpy-30 motif
MAALEVRLRGRGSEDDATIRTRLENAAAELAAAQDAGLVSHVVVNEDVDAAYGELCKLLSAHLGVPVQAGAAGTEAAAGGAAPAAADGGVEGLFGDEAGPSGGEPGQAPKDYLRETVVTPLREALVALNAARPGDPLQFLIDKLGELKVQQGRAGEGAQLAQPSLL